MANYFVHVELVHDHECMWKDTTVTRVYPVWKDGTYERPGAVRLPAHGANQPAT